jgi:DNA-binding transcriptional LysR family regulator
LLRCPVIDVRRLNVLRAVVETGSVAAAAELLSYTPSAVSQQCEHTSRVLAAVQDAEDALAAWRSGRTGRLRLAAFPTASSALVPGALADFRSRLPDVALDFVVAEPDEATNHLRAGSVDVAVVVLPRSPGEPVNDGLVHHHLLADPFRAVLPRSHPLAAKRQLDIALAAGEPWIGVSSCPDLCALVVELACARAGFRPRYALEADEYPTALGFIAAGLGVALVPMMALSPSPHPGVAVRRVKGIQPERQVWALTRDAIADELAVRVMIACLKRAADEFVTEVVGPIPGRVTELATGTG